LIRYSEGMAAQAQSAAINPTKKQYELLLFIDNFIKDNGYGPSYREIMRALNYKSVSTVAVHIDNLISRGHLRKRDNSARSLEVIDVAAAPKTTPEVLDSTDAIIERCIRAKIADLQKQDDDKVRQDIQTLQSALQILGYEEPRETDSA
jgi:lexA repressor